MLSNNSTNPAILAEIANRAFVQLRPKGKKQIIFYTRLLLLALPCRRLRKSPTRCISLL